MCLLYGISFLCSIFGVFGVGHLFAGKPMRALSYLIAGLLWMLIFVALLSVVVGICLIPFHLAFAHFCAADAVRIARD